VLPTDAIGAAHQSLAAEHPRQTGVFSCMNKSSESRWNFNESNWRVKVTGTSQPREKEYFRKDGSRVPVLVAREIFEWNRDEGVAFVFDLTERKHVEGALRDAQANLAMSCA
jgi:hypothetical protein